MIDRTANYATISRPAGGTALLTPLTGTLVVDSTDDEAIAVLVADEDSEVAAAFAASFAQKWEPLTAVATDAIREAPTGETIKRTAAGTTRAAYDATEIALWTTVGGGGGASTLDYTGAADDVVVTSKVTADTVQRFTQLADGTMRWNDGDDDTEPRATGLFYHRYASYDFGVGEPFLSGYVNLLVVGDPDDPWGEDIKTGDVGEVELGYFMRVNGGLAVQNSMAVFSDYQPFIVLGRLGIQTTHLDKRPRGEGEDLAIGVAITDTDYFRDIEVGDVAFRAYGAGIGQPTTGRFRRILLGSNDGSQHDYGESSMSVGAGDVQFNRPINFTGPAASSAGAAIPANADLYGYLSIDGIRYKVPLIAEPIQAIDSFTRLVGNGSGLVAADTGQEYFISKGTWQVNGGAAYALTLTSGRALALLTIDPDCTIAADITPTGAVNAACLAHRVTDGSATNFLQAAVFPATGAVDISKVASNGASTSLASGTTAAWPNATTHRLGFKADGNNLTVYVDGVSVLTHTLAGGDIATFAGAANCGFIVYDTVTAHDNLTVTLA